MTTSTTNTAALDTFELWFFRDLTEDQRMSLFRLAGLPVEEIVSQAAERLSIRYVTNTLTQQQGGEQEAVGEGCGLCGGFCNHPEEHTPPRHPADEGVAMQWPRGVLNRDKTLELLISHNEWRRGKEGPQTDPRLLGLALEATIAALQAGPRERGAAGGGK